MWSMISAQNYQLLVLYRSGCQPVIALFGAIFAQNKNVFEGLQQVNTHNFRFVFNHFNRIVAAF